MLNWLLYIAGLVEEGYLYSVGTEKLLTYVSSKDDTNIMLAHEGMRPKKFRINELKSPYSGSVRLTPVDRTPGDVVADVSANDQKLIQWPEHGYANQIFTLEMAPNMLIKLKVEGKCIEATKDSKYLVANDCEHYESKPGQYFRWVPDILRQAMSNPTFANNFLGRNSSKPGRYSEKVPGRSNSQDRYGGYDRCTNPSKENRPPPSYFDMPGMISTLAPINQGNYNDRCEMNCADDNELLNKIHQFDRIMLQGG